MYKFGCVIRQSSFLKIKDLLWQPQRGDDQRPRIMEVMFPSKLINMAYSLKRSSYVASMTHSTGIDRKLKDIQSKHSHFQYVAPPLISFIILPQYTLDCYRSDRVHNPPNTWRNAEAKCNHCSKFREPQRCPWRWKHTPRQKKTLLLKPSIFWGV